MSTVSCHDHSFSSQLFVIRHLVFLFCFVRLFGILCSLCLFRPKLCDRCVNFLSVHSHPLDIPDWLFRSSGFLISCFPLSSFTSSFWWTPFFPRRLFFFFLEMKVGWKYFPSEFCLLTSLRIFSTSFSLIVLSGVPFVQLESHLDWFSNFLIFFLLFPNSFFFLAVFYDRVPQFYLLFCV